MVEDRESPPAVAKNASVDLIGSKWEVSDQSPGVQIVDVTDNLVALFHVSPKGLEWASGIKTQQTLPIEQTINDAD